ncbi:MULTISPECIES: CerR family C-terminal domain-containing protein [unclassified Variovorax]|uniref:CerR family C-terminal domain-containing protein n=1 Tax=unclassified Variovorax TaxID=663243 RepID=UPI001BD60CA4|nr:MULTISPECIES: CerR family C-terminal domain-containing protein [unclassified Variovorax]
MPVASQPPHPTRSDGVEARGRILHAALALFAEKGFAKTSTREIAQAAGANIAAISYYFGDKAGLYAATFSEPMGGDAGELISHFTAPGLSLEEALRIFMTGYVAPLKDSETARQCMRLHMRELIEPTSQWKMELDRDLKEPHDALVALICKHLGVPANRADDDMHRLAFSVTGLAIQLFVMQDVIGEIRPPLLRTPSHIDTWAERLVQYALALVASEAQRRAGVPESQPQRAPIAPKKKSSKIL